MRPLALVPLLALAAACAGSPADTDTAATAAVADVTGRTADARVDADLRAARAATARFQSFAVAERENYTFLFGGACFADPTAGAMGFHYVNTALLDDEVSVTEPEAVMYEPQPNGSLKLVGLEYVVPDPERLLTVAPTLFGQDFSYNEGFGLWTLHLWLWRENPEGLFVGWNPDVSCANAGAAATRAGHVH